ncbi:hypothetical protein Nmul_A1012 [Nitrosospira multiformis ATCC 25196]|uniref:Uncharacterized protein n=1 Tax=Nitrosospira multiformis (strain ATCC 25196 / NCIMB 11849 / C 71) TaxID=323848 RepID=Q2YAA6_NITMU|nr:hypothetical protein Nmul_A1012 [Nitrosospira multiformis ATCC 25196]
MNLIPTPPPTYFDWFNHLRFAGNDQIRKDRAASFFAGLLLLLLLPQRMALAGNDSFEANCEKLMGPGKVAVVYLDIAPAEDSSRTARALQSVSGKTGDAYHNVYGLTHAEPEFRYEFRTRQWTSTDGRTCMVPDVSVKLGFAAMRVYLARELDDSCRRNIVREHELEHVSAWRSHFRIGARMLEEPLRAAFSQPRYYASQNQARSDSRPWVEGILQPLQQHLMKGVIAAHRAIDSPVAYQRVTQRLRACPERPREYREFR